MNEQEQPNDTLILKMLVFQLHSAGYTQDAISAYLGKAKKTINEILKPLQEKGPSR